MAWRYTGPPVAELLTLAECRAYLKITAEDALQDAEIEAARDAAIEEIEAETGAALICRPIEETFEPPSRGQDLALALSPVHALASVSVRLFDGQSVALDLASAGAEVLDPHGRALLRVARWPGVLAFRPDAVTVRYHSGYGHAAGDVPKLLRAGVKLLMQHRFEQREAVAFGSAPAEIPRGVSRICALHRRKWL